MRKLSLFIVFSLFAYLPGVFADEGMWLPLLLEKLNIKDMQEKGLKLSAEDIYSINQASLKDAIVIFGGGCTGELISEEGLLITNHHCGYGAIQSHSSVENDYLTDGFWAMSREDELPNRGLSVQFLKRMEDVSDAVLKGVKQRHNEEKRQALIDKNIDKIKEEAVKGTHYKAVIKPFYYGNEYYMFIYEEYTDVRLVGAPPSSIGKFGGDTDNWMWPRHTGDFSLFRIYANKDNQPADFSPDNTPYKPIKHMPVSLEGIEQGDFTMVMGYPGSTEQFITSHAVDLVLNQRNPHRIDLRTKRLEIMSRYMEQSPGVRIKYASKYAGVSNAWKKWQGENRGLKRLNAIQKKEQTQRAFAQWAAADKKREKEYGYLLQTFESIYDKMGPYAMAIDYYRESILAVEVLRFASYFDRLVRVAEESPEQVARYAQALSSYADRFYKDYEAVIDKQVAKNLLPTYAENVEEKYVPGFLTQQLQTYDTSYDKYVNYLFDETLFTDEEKIKELLHAQEPEKLLALKNDPVFQLQNAFRQLQQTDVEPMYLSLNDELDKL
ncbi:MAG: S46 family peptidase, partial [Bacteroidota bacterium]